MMPPVSENTALFLDIDGTLLDLAQTPDRVKVPRDLIKALGAWDGHGCLVVNMSPQPPGRVLNESDVSVHGIRIEMKNMG